MTVLQTIVSVSFYMALFRHLNRILTEWTSQSDHIFNVIHNVIQCNSQFSCKKQLGNTFALMDLKKNSLMGLHSQYWNSKTEIIKCSYQVRVNPTHEEMRFSIRSLLD